jgi:Spy/CpxP family protein refolding chaperone
VRRIWILVLLASLGLNVGLAMTLWQRPAAPPDAALAPPAPDWPEPDHPRPEEFIRDRFAEMNARISEELGLSPEQQEVWRQARERALAGIWRHRLEVRDARRDLHSAMLAEKVDTVAVRGLVRRLTTTQAALDSLVAESFLAELAILTTDQRLLYLERMPWGDHEGRRGHGRGRGGHGREGHAGGESH